MLLGVLRLLRLLRLLLLRLMLMVVLLLMRRSLLVPLFIGWRLVVQGLLPRKALVVSRSCLRLSVLALAVLRGIHGYRLVGVDLVQRRGSG